MGAIVLKLAGPLQSWGSDSRFVERKTRHEPTKSGVVGLLAAALGRSREDAIDDLASFPMAVRVDQPGSVERDFQTARKRVFDKDEQRWVSSSRRSDIAPLSRRYYLADAVFVVAVEVPDRSLDELADSLNHPSFPLYLGRRSCPPSERILFDAYDGLRLGEALRQVPWQATNRALIRENMNSEHVPCDVFSDDVDDVGDELGHEYVRDMPSSFSVEHREYELRKVIRSSCLAANPHFVKESAHVEHDPMKLFEEVE